MKAIYTIQNFAKRLVMVLAVGLMAINVWGADETLTVTGSVIGSGSGYGTSTGNLNTSASTSIGLSWTDVLKGQTYIQMKAGTGELHSTSYPSTNNKIKTITVTVSAGTVQLKGSTDGSTWSSPIDFTSGTAVNVSSSNYKYFKITSTGSYATATSVVVVYTASTPQTVTFDKQGGTFDDESVFTRTTPSYQIDEASGGAGVTLPLVNPSAACAAEGWGFYGWKASSAVTSETTTAPTIVGKAGDTYYPAGATTLYAVFAKGEYTKITSSGDLESDKKYIIAIESSGGDYYVVTDSYSYSSVGEIKCKQISETSSNKYSAAAINANWRYSIEGSGTYYIRDVVSSSSNNYVDFAYLDFYGSEEDDEDMYTFTFDGDGYCWIENDYAYAYFDETNYTFTRNTDDVSEFFLYKETSTPYYNSNPSCCANEVSVSESGSSHISSMTFSESSVATCSSTAADRQVTITVTPSSGYTLFGSTKPVFTKTSGTVTAAYVSGPTDNGNGTFSYIYQFTKDDSGAGTFAISPGQFTNYRTVCCTPLGEIDGDVTLSQLGTPNATKLKATWSMDSETGIDSYDLEVYDSSDNLVKTINDYTSGDDITGLDPCTTYYVALYTVSDGDPYCDGGLIGISDEVTTIGYTYTVNATNCQLTSTSDPVPDDMCEGDVLVYYEATGGSTLPDDITVTNVSDKGTGWWWDSSTGELGIDADYVTGDVTVTIFASCPGFSFHYGNDGDDASLWTIACFGDAVSNVRTIEDFEIPSKTHFYVGYQGTYTAGNSDATNKPNSSTLTWSSLYFDASIGDGVRPMVGQATGAVGTLKIIDNSNWTNKKASFIPEGYVLKFGSSEYPFTVHNGHEYRSDLVTYNSTTVADGVSVGIEDADGDYVATANTSEMRHIFLNTGGTDLWSKDNASNFALYDDTEGHKYFTCLMVAVPGESYLYEGWVPTTCEDIIICRMASSTLEWGAGNSNVWNYVVSQELPDDKNLFTISAWSTGSWSAYARNGKFRMNEDWTDKNWYVRFNPYNVLTYDKNNSGASGTMSTQSVAADAVSKSVSVVANGFDAPTGYHFDHWDAEPDGTGSDYAANDSYTLSADATLYAIWAPNTNTAYTVKHYKQKLDGTYPASPDETDNLTGTTGASITPDRKSYTGFTAPSGTTTTILADGSRVVEYQYSRNSYTLAWSLDGGEISVAGTTAGSVKYEASLTAPTVVKTGYTFASWSPSVPSTMPAANSTYTATWTANTNTAYTVKHYKQKLDGTYPASPDETDNLTGTTGASITPARKSYTGFTAPDAQTETIAADGSLVITYNYTRNKYNVAVASVGDVTITATPSGGSAIAEGANANVYYGQSVTLAYSSITSGYYWAGWKVTDDGDDDVTGIVVSTNTLTVPAYDVTVSAGLFTGAIAWCDPDIEVTGDVHLTSYKNIPVNSTSGADNLISISSSDFGSATRLDVAYLDADAADAEVDPAESVFLLCNDGSVNYDPIDGFDLDYEWGTTHSIKYTPNAYDKRDNYKLQFILKRGDKVLKTVTHNIYGRALPQEFVIASKYLGHWYALPNTMGTATETVTPIQITVDNATTPTEASYAPSTTVYKGAARKTATSNRNSIRLTNDGSHWLITNNSDAKLGLSATETEGYENREVWYLKSSTFGAYELAMDPAQSPTKKLGMYNGNMGMYADPAYTSEDIYLLPIDTKYTPIEATATDWMKDIIGVTASTTANKLGIAKENGTEYAAVTLASEETSHVADFDGDIDFTGLTGEKLLLKWYDGSTLVGGSQVTVPSIILAGSNDEWSDFASDPTLADYVVLSNPMEINVVGAKAKRIEIDQSGSNTGSIEIPAGKELIVAETVRKFNGSSFGATAESDIVISSDDSDGLGGLVMGDHDGTNKATVYFATLSHGKSGSAASVSQYVGTPFCDESTISYDWYNSWVYGITYDGSGNIGWTRINGDQGMTPFKGYAVISADPAGHVYEMGGSLNPTANRTMDGLNWQSEEGAANPNNENLLANGWMAPIKIAAMELSDFVNADATIYIFNSGSPDDYKNNNGATTYGAQAGQYSAYPIIFAGDAVIPAMQSFSVYTNASGGSGVTLDYKRLVYDPAVAGTTPVPNRAPLATKNADEANKLKLFVKAESGYGDMLYMWEREDFTDYFENGWDARKVFGETTAPQLYAVTPDGKMAVNCVPTFEGVVMGFKAGDNENFYTFTFECDDEAEALYLVDTDNNAYTRVLSTNSYWFTTSDKEAHNRFILTHNAPGGTTGIDNTGNVQGTKAYKVIMHDKMYIIYGDEMYDATGKRVNEIK